MYQPVFDHVHEIANKDEANRKLFVHNLPYEANADAVQRAMAEFGEIESSALTTDKQTGRNKGYAFVTYKTMASFSPSSSGCCSCAYAVIILPW